MLVLATSLYANFNPKFSAISIPIRSMTKRSCAPIWRASRARS